MEADEKSSGTIGESNPAGQKTETGSHCWLPVLLLQPVGVINNHLQLPILIVR